MKEVFDDDDDDDEEDDDHLLVAASKKVDNEKPAEATEAQKAKEQRERKLREMMDVDDDEAMEDAPDSPVQEEIDDSKAIDTAKKPSDEPTEQATSHDGRRRGRRRVMKKKTYTDEAGYLVTKEEAEWESFSEDEPPALKSKSSFQSTGGGSKKKAQGKGQGNIMSFFGKK